MKFNTLFIILIIVSGFIEVIRRISKDWEWLRLKTSQIPYFNGITITLSAIFFLVGVCYQGKTEIDKKTFSFFVIPDSIDVVPGYNKNPLLKIVNNQDFPIFQIDLKVLVEKGDLSLDDIKLQPKDEPKLKSKLGGILILHDVFGISYITKEGIRENHFIIHEVDAHSTKEFFVDINANNAHQPSKITFEIVRTDKKESEVFTFDPFVYCQSEAYDLKTYIKISADMLDRKKYKEAIVCCEKAIMKDPRSAKGHTNMGIAFLFLNETDKAIHKFEEAIAIDPQLPQPYINLAGILMQQHKFENAIKRLKIASALDGPSQPQAFVMWGQCLALQNDVDGAIKKYKKAIELNPKSGDAYFHWGVLYKVNHDCRKAIKKFEKATVVDHAFKLDSYGLWGACLESLGRHKEAAEKYQKIIEIAPDSIAADKSRKSIIELKKKHKLN